MIRDALAQLPGHRPRTRPARRVLVRTDAAGCTHAVLDWLAGQRLSYSVGFTLPDNAADLVALIPNQVWAPAYHADGQIRDGAWVAEVTDLLELSSWPKGMRVIVRAERPHPGAKLRRTDADGHRLTAFATNTTRGQLADLQLRHRRRARCEDRIRCAKDTGLMNLPLHDLAQNKIRAPAGWRATTDGSTNRHVILDRMSGPRQPSRHRGRRIPLQSVRGPTPEMTDTLRLLFYLVETERQAEIFNDALEDSVAAALVSGDSLRTWRHLQGALFAAIIVNRLVTNDGTQRGRSGWTSKQAKDAATWRVKELRRLLELPEADPRATPIYDVRGLRDSLEHIDERIDRAVHSAGVLSLSDWYLSDGRLITTPEESDAEGRQAGLRAFYPEGGLALFDRRSLDLFALDLDMMKLRHNAREAEAELAQSLKGRCRFGGGQLRNIQFLDGEPDRVAWWRRRRQEILSEFAPSARLDGYVRLWAEPGQPPNQ